MKRALVLPFLVALMIATVSGVSGQSRSASQAPVQGDCFLRAMVPVGPTCVDRYEASVWKTTDPALVAMILSGHVTLAHLLARGATQLGLAAGDLTANGCPATGSGCIDVFAVSIPGVLPARFINWFQAAAAARNAGKRLLTNAEWQVAALGTPDPDASQGPDDCNTSSTGPDSTGVRANCVSDAGAFDMVGNVAEWVADWLPLSTACVPPLFGSDFNCLAGASTTGGPAAPIRGGSFDNGTGGAAVAGVFAVSATSDLKSEEGFHGFRAGR